MCVGYVFLFAGYTNHFLHDIYSQSPSPAPRNIDIDCVAADRLHRSPTRSIVCAGCVPSVNLSNLFNLKYIKASFSCHQREVCSERQTSLLSFVALEAFTGHMLLFTGYIQSSALNVTKHSSRF